MARPMRILAFCGGTYVSGMEIKALDLLSALADRGHQLHVIANAWNDGDFIGRLGAHGLPYETVFLGKLTKSLQPKHLWWTANTAARLPGALFRVRRHLRAFDPDVVLLFNRDAALLAAPLLRHRRCVFHVAELPEPTPWTRRLYGRLDTFVERWIGVSHFVGERLPAFGILPDKVRVVYNGIPEAVAAPPKGTAPRDGPVTLGICGQIGPWKGHDDLLDALVLLAKQGRSFRCLVFGRGEEASLRGLREKAAEAGIADRIEWRGFTKDLAAMYREVDVLVAPSRFEEPFGLVAAEAGLNGLPVVVTRRGGLPEIVVDGETGFVVEAERPDELADRLARLIASAELRERMGVAARRRVQERFTVERMAQEHEEVLAEVVAGA